MANQITGRIDRITPTVEIPSKDGSKTFLKREITLDATPYDPYTGERSNFENFPTFEFTGDKCAELDSFSVGQVVTISFALQGMKYNDQDGNLKYFTKVRGYKIDARQTGQATQQAAPVQQPVQQPQPDPNYQNQAPNFPPPVDANGNPKDDLPF